MKSPSQTVESLTDLMTEALYSESTYVTRPPCELYREGWSFVGAEALSEPMREYCYFDP